MQRQSYRQRSSQSRLLSRAARPVLRLRFRVVGWCAHAASLGTTGVGVTGAFGFRTAAFFGFFLAACRLTTRRCSLRFGVMFRQKILACLRPLLRLDFAAELTPNPARFLFWYPVIFSLHNSLPDHYRSDDWQSQVRRSLSQPCSLV